MPNATFVSAIGQQDAEGVEPKRYMFVQAEGDWMALYDRTTGEALMQGHPSDLDALEFLARMDALEVDIAQVDRRYYWTETMADGGRRLPNNLAQVELV